MSSLDGGAVPADDVATGTGSELQWNRPHPLTLVVEIGSALRQMLFVVFLVGFNVVQVGAALEFAVILGPLAAAIGRWYTTRYALGDDALHHHHGLLWRQRQVLPRANIQNVSTTAGIVARLGSVVELNVSDASSNGDITIRLVSRDEADRLTSLLRSQLAGEPPPPNLPPVATWPAPQAGTAVPGPAPFTPAGPPIQLPAPVGAPIQLPAPVGAPLEAAPLIKPPIADLIRFEATAMGTVTAAALALAVIIAGSAALAFGVLPVGTADGLPWVAVIAPVASLLFAAGGQVVGRVLQFGGFELRAEPDRLRIRSGLLTEARITARRERIQQVRVDRHLLHRRLGLERVAFETADLDIGSSPATRCLSPAGSAGGWQELALEAFGHLDCNEDQLQPVSPLTRRRTLVRFALGAAVTLPLWLLHPALGLATPALLMAIGWWYSRRRYQELGWALSDDQMLVRSGVLVGALHLIDLDKVQIVRTSATLFQRRLGLATLHLATAGHGFTSGLVSLPDLPMATAADLERTIASRAARTPVRATL